MWGEGGSIRAQGIAVRGFRMKLKPVQPQVPDEVRRAPSALPDDEKQPLAGISLAAGRKRFPSQLIFTTQQLGQIRQGRSLGEEPSQSPNTSGRKNRHDTFDKTVSGPSLMPTIDNFQNQMSLLTEALQV